MWIAKAFGLRLVAVSWMSLKSKGGTKMSKKKPNHAAFKHHGAFVGLPRRVFQSSEYKGLTLKARCLLDELQNIHRPNRNGRLVLSVERATERMGVSYNTARAAFNELEKAGFIKQTLDYIYMKGQAREWRLTYEPCNGREPTDDWKKD
jgi:hypothetical protein